MSNHTLANHIIKDIQNTLQINMHFNFDNPDTNLYLRWYHYKQIMVRKLIQIDCRKSGKQLPKPQHNQWEQYLQTLQLDQIKTQIPFNHTLMEIIDDNQMALQTEINLDNYQNYLNQQYQPPIQIVQRLFNEIQTLEQKFQTITRHNEVK